MDDTLAARMRAAYVGEDAIAFDELKPEVRARWERVAAVAKTKPPATREAIARALEDRWCLPGVPTPYEEADVVLAVLAECGEDDDTPIAICPQCYRAHAAVPERASDEELARLADDTFFDNMDPMPDGWTHGTWDDRGHEHKRCTYLQVRAVRARVEAPLLAEIARLEASCAWNKQAADSLRAELESVTAERDANVKSREIAIDSIRRLEFELAALRQRDTVPVKVRFDVTEVDLYRAYQPNPKGQTWSQFAFNYLAAHAVLDVPAGVRSVEELTEIGLSSEVKAAAGGRSHRACSEAFATAIRDAVLRGMGAEYCAGCMNPFGSTDAPVWTDEQIEKLAIALFKGSDPRCAWEAMSEIARDSYRAYARAAVYFMRVGPPVAGVDPDMWKTPLECRSFVTPDEVSLHLKAEHQVLSLAVVHGHDWHRCMMAPADAARVAAHLASYAAAHGCPVGLHVPKTHAPKADIVLAGLEERDEPIHAHMLDEYIRGYCEANGTSPSSVSYSRTGFRYALEAMRKMLEPPARPEGMPSVRDLREIGLNAYLMHDQAKRENVGCMVDPMGSAATAILAALRPWLREPTGWELDVTAELAAKMLQDMKASYCEKTSYSTWDQLGENYKEDFIKVFGRFLPSLASRIRPTFECAECERLRGRLRDVSAYFDKTAEIRDKQRSFDLAARAALEGE